MTKLQTWMNKQGWRDQQVAENVGISRVQVSRIRRGLVGASVPTAMRLQELTGLRYWHFLVNAEQAKKLRPTRKAKAA